MSSEKTLLLEEQLIEEGKRATKQAQTFSSKILMGISAADVPPGVMEFYIDNPVAMNNRCKGFLTRPLAVACIGRRAGPAIIATAYLEAHLALAVDMFILERHVLENNQSLNVPEALRKEAGVLIVDRALADRVIDKLGESAKRLESIVVVGEDDWPERRAVYAPTQVIFCENYRFCLEHFVDRWHKNLQDQLMMLLILTRPKKP